MKYQYDAKYPLFLGNSALRQPPRLSDNLISLTQNQAAGKCDSDEFPGWKTLWEHSHARRIHLRGRASQGIRKKPPCPRGAFPAQEDIMERLLLKIARQLNGLDEASLMALWPQYLQRVQDFDGS